MRRLTWPIWSIAILLLVVVLTAVSYGDDTASPGTTVGAIDAGPQTVELPVLVLADSPNSLTDEAVTGVAEVLEARLAALDLDGSRVETTSESAFLRVTVPVDAEDLVREALAVHRVELRPVLERRALTPQDEPMHWHDRPVDLTGPVGVTDAHRSEMYRLGPVALDGNAVESATAEPTQGTWAVTVVLRAGPDGIDAFNRAAAACYRGEPTCPAQEGAVGAIAIVDDLVVISAPSIQTPQFERDEIMIAGMDEPTARALAAALSTPSPELDWQVLDVSSADG